MTGGPEGMKDWFEKFSISEILLNMENPNHPINSPCIGHFDPEHINCKNCDNWKECNKKFGKYYEQLERYKQL